MKYKQKVEFIESLFLLLVGIVLVLLPIYVEPKIEIDFIILSSQK